MYSSNCLSGVCYCGEDEYDHEAWRIKHRIEMFRSIPGIYLELKLDKDGKFDKRDLDRAFGRPIDEIRKEEAIRKENEKAVDEWVGPTANDIILDCLNLLRKVRNENIKKLHSHLHGREEERIKKEYVAAIDRMAMKFRCPAKIAVKLKRVGRTEIQDDWWWVIMVPMKDMLEAAKIKFDGDKFTVDGKDIPVSEFLGPDPYENPEKYKKKEPTPCKKPFGLYAIRRDKRNPEYWFDEVLLHSFDTEAHALEYKGRILEGTTYVRNIGGKQFKFESSPRITKYDTILEKYPEMVVMPINHTKKC